MSLTFSCSAFLSVFVRLLLWSLPFTGSRCALVEAGAARSAGLVPSINNVKTGSFVDPRDVIQVDKLQARCTRLRKNLGVAAKWLSKSGGNCWMLTFTYADVEAWRGSHMRDALRHLRQWLLRAFKWRLKYLWVMETKKRLSGAQIGRSAPHYHCVVWVPCQVTKDDLKFDDRGWWPHGLTNAIKAVAPIRYVMKYASKFDNAGQFPKGARIYGIGGLCKFGADFRRWVNWPSFVQGNSACGDRSRRAVGGGWVIGSTGEWLPSEWGLTASDRQSTRLVRLRHHPRLIDSPSGPYSWIPS